MYASPVRRTALGRALFAVAVIVTALLATSRSAAQGAALPTVTVSLTSSSITVAGAATSGAVNVVSTAAKGMKEPAPAFVLLKPGVTVAEAEAFLATNKTVDPNTVSSIGSLVFDAEARPGGRTEVQTTLSPGTYLAVNAEGEKSSKWRRTSFTVTANPSPVALATAGAVEKTIDFAFMGPKTLHQGELVRFENEGFLVHMDLVFPAKSKKAAERLARDLLTGREKAAEKLVAARPTGFAGPLSTGGLQQETITAAPGWYVQVCFMDTQDHRSHTRLGMERVIRITR